MDQREVVWDIPEKRRAQETFERRSRCERLRGRIDKLFPPEKTSEGVRQAIQDSLDVPQWGEYHNEGMYMDTHLDRILDVLEDARQGVFDEAVPESIKYILQATADQREQLEQYAFLHDIEKRDCMLVKFDDGRTESLDWAAWKVLAGELADEPNPERLAKFFKQQGISSISYYHPENKAQQQSGKKHGSEGVEFLQAQGYVMSPVIQEAIGRHEVAYQFSRSTPAQYEKHFGDLSEEARNFVLLASYSDTMASLRENGSPDLGNFLAVVESMRQAGVLVAVKELVAGRADLDSKKLFKWMAAANETGGLSTVEAALEAIESTCRPSVYNLEVLSHDLAGLVDEETAREMLELVREGRAEDIGRHYGKKLGSSMGKVRAALQAAEVK